MPRGPFETRVLFNFRVFYYRNLIRFRLKSENLTGFLLQSMMPAAASEWVNHAGIVHIVRKRGKSAIGRSKSCESCENDVTPGISSGERFMRFKIPKQTEPPNRGGGSEPLKKNRTARTACSIQFTNRGPPSITRTITLNKCMSLYEHIEQV